MSRLGLLLLVLTSCVTQTSVSRDALRYPHAVAPGEPTVLEGVDESGEAREVELRPDTRMTLQLRAESLETRARYVSLTDDAIVVEGDRGERRIPWDETRGAYVSESRPWLAFLVVVGAGAVAGAAVLVSGVGP